MSGTICTLSMKANRDLKKDITHERMLLPQVVTMSQ
jgi:hypothetical protein